MIERDITRRKQADEQQKMLLAELNHRVKNALATVLSIASRTRKVTDSLDEYYRAFEGRLRALASTHDLLAKNIWAGAYLRQILLAELEPYKGGKETILISGRNLFVSSRAAVVFGMIFHELVTNAAKYGALSDTGGNVQVRRRGAASPSAGGRLRGRRRQLRARMAGARRARRGCRGQAGLRHQVHRAQRRVRAAG